MKVHKSLSIGLKQHHLKYIKKEKLGKFVYSLIAVGPSVGVKCELVKQWSNGKGRENATRAISTQLINVNFSSLFPKKKSAKSK